jgi:NADPH2:quinone reductase
VYDGVGKTTFEKGLNVLRPRGVMALFGQSSGKVDLFDPGVLAAKGSLFLTRPSLLHHILTTEELNKRASEVLSWVAKGKLKVRIERTFPLAEAKAAHDALEGRKTTGKVVLLP